MKPPKRTDYLVNYLVSQFQNAKNPPPPFLIKGPEGCGRSWILSLLASKLEKEKELILVRLPYHLTGEGLTDSIKSEISRIETSKFSDEPISDLRKKKVAVLIERLDLLFNFSGTAKQLELPKRAKGRGATQLQQINHASELRGYAIENRSRVSFVGTSDLDTRFMDDPDLPFFNFFNVIEVKPLSPDESREYLRLRTGSHPEYDQMTSAIEDLSVDAIFQLTEGLISHLNLLSNALQEFLSANKKIDLKVISNVLESYFNAVSPRMMHMIDQLTYAERVVIDRCVLVSGQFRVRDIQTSDGYVSKHVLNLKEKGFLAQIDKDSLYYRMASSSFRCWLRYKKRKRVEEIFR